MSAKTIQIFLADGDPSGIRIAELTTRTVLAVAFPKTKLTQFLNRKEADHIATYFLFGGDDNESKSIAYIGQTEDLKARLKSHDANKEFWSSAVVLISRTHTFTQAHIKWLEWFSILKAKESNRYKLDNGNAGSEPFVTEPMKADLEEIFETGTLLIESLGYPIFKTFVEKSDTGEVEENQELWYLEGPQAKATGTFTSEGFIVLKGSRARAQFAQSATDSFFSRKRDNMAKEGVLVLEGKSYVFTEDYPFKSPSGAAGVALARHANGWKDWKDKAGRTLDEVKRRD